MPLPSDSKRELPIATLNDTDKVALLERIDKETRKLDPRITQVMASLNAVHEVVMVVNSPMLLLLVMVREFNPPLIRVMAVFPNVVAPVPVPFTVIVAGAATQLIVALTTTAPIPFVLMLMALPPPRNESVLLIVFAA